MKAKDGKQLGMNDAIRTNAGKWSVALAIAPIAGIGLFLLPVLLGDYHGEAGLGALLAIGAILFFGAHAAVAAALLGAGLGIFAIRKTRWRQGGAGLVLNIALFIAGASALAAAYYHMYVDPTRLQMAAFHGDRETVEKLLAKGFDINYEMGAALGDAARSGHTEIVELLLSRGADVKIGDPLGKAVSFDGTGSVEVARLLLKHGADPNRLLGAAGSHDKELVKLLLDHGADVNQRDAYERTPLHLAISSGKEDNAELLIQSGADVNAKNRAGETPLHLLASMWPQREWAEGYRIRGIEMLLNAGADIESKTEGGKTALWLASEAAWADAVEALLKRGADPENISDLHVRFAAVGSSIDETELAEWVRANAPDVHIANAAGESLLHWVVKGGNVNLAAILLAKGVDANISNEEGDTALHWAAHEPAPAIISLLVTNGANVNTQNKKGKTPLHLATTPVNVGDEKLLEPSRREAIEILLANGAETDIPDNDGVTPEGQLMRWLPAKEQGRQYKQDILDLMQRYRKPQ